MIFGRYHSLPKIIARLSGCLGGLHKYAKKDADTYT
jgi:hypothetical protein